MARKKVEKAPLSPKEAASKEFAMTSCVHSGDPSYRFEVGDSVSIGALKNCVVDEVCEDGKYYGIKYGKDGACYGYWSWLDVRPIPTSLEAKYAQKDSPLFRMSFSNRSIESLLHMVTETRQLRDGEKLTEFYNRIDWKPLFEFVQRYYGIGVEQPPVPCLKPNGRIEVNWPENLRDKCGLFGHTYREVYLQTFSSCCFHDITYDKDIVDKYLARPDFYRLNISLENDCNGTSSDAYLQLTFSLKHIEFSGGYNFANLFSAEYRKDTGWFVVSGEGKVLMGAKK